MATLSVQYLFIYLLNNIINDILGGSTAVNQAVYFRGAKRDYEEWKEQYGLDNWGYDNVLPFFKRFENNEDIIDSNLHGHDGPINISMIVIFYFIIYSFDNVLIIIYEAVSANHYPNPAGDAWVKAAKALGWPFFNDSSNPETTYVNI